MELQRVLASIDDLLDTRIATVATLSQAAAISFLDDRYWMRCSDDFETLSGGLITNVAYREAYAKRNTALLRSARPTGMPFAFQRIFNDLNEQAINTPFVGGTSLDINVWPYHLTEAERDKLILLMSVYVGHEVKISTVYYSPTQLTPSLVKEKWECLVMYDYDNWLKIHQEELIRCRIPRNTLMVPAVSPIADPKREDYVFAGVGEMNPFAGLEMALSEFIGMDMVEPALFSIAKL